jgi:transcriptional regulator GlxA family with amidase domain
MPKLIAIAIFDGFQLLDAAGPAQVFASANALAKRDLYDVRILAAKAGLVGSAGGIELNAAALESCPPGTAHTALVAGGSAEAVTAAVRDKKLVAWLAAHRRTARRIGSICSGAFLLAAAGALKGKRATTHWEGAKRLAEYFPDTRVDADAIYLVDGKIWTSAGVTTGIDMALAMVAADHGRDLAAQTAKQLVVYMHRPGHQSQFSAPLEIQTQGGDRFAALAAWAETRLRKDLSVEALAKAAGMSPRNFHRHLKADLNTTPRKWVEDLRLSYIRAALEETQTGLDVLAASAGFSGPDHLIKTFARRMGLTPGSYRRLHGHRKSTPEPLEPRNAAQ